MNEFRLCHINDRRQNCYGGQNDDTKSLLIYAGVLNRSAPFINELPLNRVLFPDDQQNPTENATRSQPESPANLFPEKQPTQQSSHQGLKEKIQTASGGIH